MVGDGTYMTVGEVATRLGVSDTTVRAYVDRGKLTAYTLPSGHRRFKAEDVERLHAEIYGAPSESDH